MRKNRSKNGFFLKIHQHQPSGSSQVVLEMLPMDSRTSGIAARSRSGINPVSLDWDILGYLFLGMFCLGGIWDLKEKREAGQWLKIPSQRDLGNPWELGLGFALRFAKVGNRGMGRIGGTLNPIPFPVVDRDTFPCPTVLQAPPGFGQFQGWSSLSFSGWN